MDIRFQAGGPEVWKAAVMLVFSCKGEDPAAICPEIGEAAPWFTIAPGRKDFAGADGQWALFHGHPQQNIPRVLTVGLGERDVFSLDTLRKAVGTALAQCKAIGAESVLMPVAQYAALPGDISRLVEEAVCAAFLGLYRFTALKSPKTDDTIDPAWLALAFSESSVPDAEHAAARRGEHAAAGICLARDLANSPPNILTPITLGEAAEALAKRHGMHCTILDEAALAELGCNALLAVGQGSAVGSRMVIVEHAPKGHEDEEPLIFIGKGLTFDSGGICLKPATNMHTMKSDMSGAAAVLGALEAVGNSNIERRIIGILACAENMPGGNAMRPGDVVKSFSGMTVEILNTDAEGRLALCDALSYAQKQWKPAFIIDIATLTGACSVALGHDMAGLFTDDAKLAEDIYAIGQTVGDYFWRLPLWQPYEKSLKSTVADISHMGPREGGAINAALYLKKFVAADIRWAHLDIAGTDWAFKKGPLSPEGAVGFGVRTLLELMRGGV